VGSSSRLRRERAAARAKAAAPSATHKRTKAREKITWTERLRYAFDNSMSKGPSALIWYLGAAVGLIVLFFGLLIWILGVGPSDNPVTNVYQSFLHAIDTGTVAGDSGNGNIILQLFVTVAGIFIFSAFIGVIANAIDARLTELRKGRSLVLESGHTLVLGWSESIFTIISELAIANESRKQGACIVILAEEDKAMMDDEIRARFDDLHGTRVVCRTGSPTAIADLELVNHDEARSVVILRPESEDPDMYVIKALLALTRHEFEDRHIVAEISDAKNLSAARTAGKGQAEVLDRGSIASRLLVQTSRQSGAARIYEDLFDFEGHEIYSRRDESLNGVTYGEALLTYEDCTLIGFQQGGDVTLNPPAASTIPEDAEVLAIAEDDSVLDLAAASSATVDAGSIVEAPPRSEPPESTLILGWNDQTPVVLQSLDDFAPQGSSAEIVATNPPGQAWVDARVEHYDQLSLSVHSGDVSDADVLESLDLDRFDRVIVMCDEEHGRERADGRVLLSLIHLREISERTGARFSIVSELIDEADRDLAEVARVDDIVISDQIISYLLAQISENRHLATVFDELLKADGSEVYIRPIGDYVKTDGGINFATLVAAGRERNETVIGYRLGEFARDGDEDFGVRLNPAKSLPLAPALGDSVIVLAED
jgi:voltage-gated potassium channel Kch